MLNTLVAIAAFALYAFVEWPRIQKRWEKAYPSFEKLLIVVSIVTGFAAIIFFILFARSIFIERQLVSLYIGAAFASFGLSNLIDYWIENKTFAYRRTSTMSSIWLLIIATFIAGVVVLMLYFLGF